VTTATPPAMTAPDANLHRGYSARRGDKVYWDAEGTTFEHRPYVVVADVTAAGVELVHDYRGAEPHLIGFFARHYLYVPAGGSRPLPGWDGWRVHCAETWTTADPWLRLLESGRVYLSYDGPPWEPPARVAEKCPF
jgi:hypothetical protein